MTSARKTAEDIEAFTEKLSRSLSQIRQSTLQSKRFRKTVNARLCSGVVHLSVLTCLTIH